MCTFLPQSEWSSIEEHLHLLIFTSPPESISDLTPLQVPGTQYHISYLHAFAQTVPAQKGNPMEATGIFPSGTLWVELGTEGTALSWAGLGLMVDNEASTTITSGSWTLRPAPSHEAGNREGDGATG